MRHLAIISGEQEKCQLPLNWKIQYPDCEAKLKVAKYHRRL